MVLTFLLVTNMNHNKILKLSASAPGYINMNHFRIMYESTNLNATTGKTIYLTCLA